MTDLKIILTGATGMVGEGVLLACLEHPDVKEVLMVNRKHSDIQHVKLRELIIPDFSKPDDFAEQLTGYDACFYCAGISSVGMSEEKYTHITYDTTMHFATKLAELNPNMVFTFVSGSHTDSSENGGVMWARVKGRTENALKRLPFKGEYNFRPGGMKTVPGQKNTNLLFKVIVAVMSVVVPKLVISLQELAQAMINATTKGYPSQVLEIKDIKALAKA